jgi:4-oxalomesaconate tautomerase
VVDEVDGLAVTLIDNGMPVALVEAAAVGVTGHESPAELEADDGLAARIERLRLAAGQRMGLGDVTATTVPKMCLVAPPAAGGSLATRMFIPHRVHTAIGVLAAVTAGTAAALPGSVAARVCRPVADPEVPKDVMRLEHPSGWFDVVIDVAVGDGGVHLGRSAIVSTARLLMAGTVYPKEIR